MRTSNKCVKGGSLAIGHVSRRLDLTVERRESLPTERAHVTAADHFMNHYAARGGAAGMYLAVAVVPMLLAGAFIVVQRADLLPASPVLAAAYAAGVAAIAFAVARFVFGVGASDTAPVEMGAVSVACPECGAPASLDVGDAVAVCEFCGGQLVATAIAVEHGIDGATQARREAALQRFRKEREVMLHINRTPAVMKTLVPLMAVFAVGGIVYAAFQESPGDGIIALGCGTVLVAVGATFVARATLRERARLQAYRDLAQQLNTRLGHGVESLVAWLNRYWPASYPPQHLYTHAHLIDANTGYPTLVALKEGRAEAFLAADMHDARANEESNREKEWVRKLGFVIKKTEAGVWLEATPQLLQRLSRDVEAHRLFAPALTHAARMLRAMAPPPR
jgi:hypothetical protein